MWRPITAKNAEGDTTNVSYPSSSNGFLQSERSTTSGNSTDDVLTTLDALGRAAVQQRKQSPTSSEYDSVETTYDLDGRPYQVSMPYQAVAGAKAPTGTAVTTTTYDALSRAVKVVDGGGGEADYSYNQNDVLSTVDAAGGAPAVSRQEQFDPLGRLTSVCELTAGTGIGGNWPAGACGQSHNAGNGYLTTYARSPLGEITAVTQNAQGANKETRSYAFDELGRLTEEVNPETKNLPVYYTYDSDSACSSTQADAGELVKRINARGITICYLHDADHSGRLVEVTYSDGTPAKYFVYATANPQTVEGFSVTDAVGRLAEAYTGSRATDDVFSYDKMGRPAFDAQKTPDSGGWVQAEADYAFNGALTYLALLNNGGGSLLPAGISYGLDGEGRPDYAAAGSSNLVTAASYTPLGLASVTYASGDGHTDTDSYSYNAATGRLAGYSFSVDGATDAGTYNWLANGELGSFSISDGVAGTADNGFTCTYAHDDMGRLSAANCGASSNQTYTFDPFGDVCKTAAAGTNFCPVYNLYNQITTVSYDNDGDPLSDPVSGFTNAYNAEGRATTFDNVAVTYDALNRAVEAGGQEFIYAPGGGKIAVMNGQTLVRADIPLVGGAEAIYNGSGFVAYRHSDLPGSSRLATSYSGGLYAETALAPYGEPLLETGTRDRSFTGAKQDIANGTAPSSDANGEYDFLAREYSPTQSRWWTPDPAGPGAVDPNNPQSWDRYAYVNNQPLAMVDPSGLCGVIFDGITESRYSAGGQKLIAYAKKIHADVAFGLPDSGYAGGMRDVGSILFGTAGASVGVAALKDAVSQGGPLDVMIFSGGAQTLLNSLSADPGLASRVNSVTYYSPGTNTPSLFSPGQGAAAIVFGTGLADDLATLSSDWSTLPAAQTGCGHDFPCEVAAVPPLGTGGSCKNPKVFTPSGVTPLGGGGGGNFGGFGIGGGYPSNDPFGGVDGGPIITVVCEWGSGGKRDYCRVYVN